MLRTLLADAIDYAGLFPPAALAMSDAVANFAEYERGPDRWALGRFVVPVARLAELESAADSLAPRAPAAPWRLSALLSHGSGGASHQDEIASLGALNCRHAAAGAPALVVDTVETRAGSAEAIESLLHRVPRWLQAYVEVPLEPDPAPLVAAIARGGGRAKMRAGGVTIDAFPSAERLLRFLRACTAQRVPFKATAGLHHPLRGEYRLTYAPDADVGTMHGWVNLFLAAAFLRAGMADRDLLQLLEERSTAAFDGSAETIVWRGNRLGADWLRETRAGGIVAFGSCSFIEPVGEARAMGLRESA